MSKKFDWVEFKKRVTEMPEDRRKYLEQCAISRRRLGGKLLEGGLEYKESTLEIARIIGYFPRLEDQAPLCDQLYKYMTQDPEPTREQVIAEANRIADEMRKEQEKE